jgi:hypothetical protein
VNPSWRKPVGMMLILSLIVFWAGLVGSQAGRIAALPGIVQAIVYAFVGIIWIAPLKPLLRWMELGRWRS